eukprot:tig00021464_g21720.t1
MPPDMAQNNGPSWSADNASIGKLKVEVCGARELKKPALSGVSEIFVQVSTPDGFQFRTPAWKENDAGEISWNEGFSIEVKASSIQHFEVRVLSKSWNGVVLIGRCIVDFSKMVTEKRWSVDSWLSLRSRDFKQSGQVRLKVMYERHSQQVAAERERDRGRPSVADTDGNGDADGGGEGNSRRRRKGKHRQDGSEEQLLPYGERRVSRHYDEERSPMRGGRVEEERSPMRGRATGPAPLERSPGLPQMNSPSPQPIGNGRLPMKPRVLPPIESSKSLPPLSPSAGRSFVDVGPPALAGRHTHGGHSPSPIPEPPARAPFQPAQLKGGLRNPAALPAL